MIRIGDAATEAVDEELFGDARHQPRIGRERVGQAPARPTKVGPSASCPLASIGIEPLG